MSFSILYFLITFYGCNLYFKDKSFSFILFIGFLIPETDILLALIFSPFIGINESIFLITNKVFNSVFFILIIYVLGLMIEEFKKIRNYKYYLNGLIFGIFTNILFTSVFSNESTYFLWPININFNILNYFFENNIEDFIYVKKFDFIFFRFYGWIIINHIIEIQKMDIFLVSIIEKWMKIQFFSFILVFILYFIKFKYLIFVWSICYSFSIITSIIFTFLIINRFFKSHKVELN